MDDDASPRVGDHFWVKLGGVTVPAKVMRVPDEDLDQCVLLSCMLPFVAQGRTE
jgi:hypothetical protein